MLRKQGTGSQGHGIKPQLIRRHWGQEKREIWVQMMCFLYLLARTKGSLLRQGDGFLFFIKFYLACLSVGKLHDFKHFIISKSLCFD